MPAASQPESTSSAFGEDQVDRLLLAVLRQPAAEREAVVAAICRAQPEHAEALRRRLRLLTEQSLMLDDDCGGDDEPPPRFARFLLRRKLASGFTDVWLADDPGSDREVVVKLLRHPELCEPAARAAFAREALAAAKVRHPSLGAVLEAGEHDGVPYLVRPFFDGIDLGEWIHRQRRRGHRPGPADVDLVLGWLEQIARALHEAHRSGLVHRDVKPANILIPWQGPPVLVDFGLCQDHTARASGETTTAGSLPYMAPEQLCVRDRPVGPPADIHALGATLFECIALHPPFRGDTAAALCRAILHEPPPRLRGRHLPRGLSRVLGAALQKQAWHRYASAADFADDLQRLRQGERVHAAELGPVTATRRWLLAHRGLAALATVLLVLLAGWPIAATLRDLRVRQQDVLARDLDLLAIPAQVAAAEAAAAALAPGWPEQATAIDRWFAEHGDPLAALDGPLRARRAELPTPGEPGPAPDDRALVVALQQAETALRAFLTERRGTLALMREHRDHARTVVATTITAHANAWRDAIAAIAADPRYGGLVLAPQPGLVPLGADKISGLQEFYHPRSAWPGTPPVQRVPYSNRFEQHDGVGLVFVLLPGGSFVMGQQATDPDAPAYDPMALRYAEPHVVTLRPFFLSKYELTKGQWLRLTGERPSYFRIAVHYGGDPPTTYRHPVESVGALDCDRVLRRFGLELPTEAQWEYACRAGSTGPWPLGPGGQQVDALFQVANLFDLRHWQTLHAEDARNGRPAPATAAFDDGFAYPCAVGSLWANAFGLFDMLGNVAEWCQDHWVPYAGSTVRAGCGLRVHDPARHVHRVHRGGSYMHCEDTSNGARGDTLPDRRSPQIGCRPMLPIRDLR